MTQETAEQNRTITMISMKLENTHQTVDRWQKKFIIENIDKDKALNRFEQIEVGYRTLSTSINEHETSS